MSAHQLGAAVIFTLAPDEDRIDRRLHVVADAAPEPTVRSGQLGHYFDGGVPMLTLGIVDKGYPEFD